MHLNHLRFAVHSLTLEPPKYVQGWLVEAHTPRNELQIAPCVSLMYIFNMCVAHEAYSWHQIVIVADDDEACVWKIYGEKHRHDVLPAKITRYIRRTYSHTNKHTHHTNTRPITSYQRNEHRTREYYHRGVAREAIKSVATPEHTASPLRVCNSGYATRCLYRNQAEPRQHRSHALSCSGSKG